MRGHIRRRGNKWAAVFDAPPDESRKRKRRWLSGFTTRKAAEAALSEALARLQTGAYTGPTKETIAMFMRRWLQSAKASVRPSTWATYETLVEKQILPVLGSTPLLKLTPAQLNSFYGGLLESGRRDGKGGLSRRTVGHIHGVIRLALGQGVRWQDLARNVADQANPPRKAKRAMRVWSSEEVGVFLDSVREDRLYAVYVLALTSGLRRGELLGLAWRDLDLTAARLQVRQTMITVNFKAQRSEPKTDAGRRSVELDPGTVAVLKVLRSRQLEERFALGLGRPCPDDFVFAAPTGEALHPGLFSDAFDRRVKAAGLPRIRFHDLRHTMATLALAAGVHPKIVQERLGHSSIAITLDLYSHSVPGMQADAASKISALVFSSAAR